MTSKRRTPRQLGHFEGGSRSGALDIESTSSAATVLGLPTPSRTDKMDVSRSALRNNGMLPTPAKTPQRATEPVRRTSKRRKVSVKGEEDQEMTDIGSRKDGLVYIFRGKRVFRRFSDAVDVDEDVSNTAPIGESSETEIDVNDLPNHQGPLTRSSVVPRLLFATEEQKKEKEARLKAAEEEEADTDIELPIMASSSSRRRTGNRTDALMESTPSEQVDCDITTPKAPRFAPYSPPTTGRATRSQKLELSDPPTESDDDRPTTPTHKLTASKRVSPFMGWQRTKGEAATSTKKRQATSLPQSSTGKKARRV
ncbi:hypothetical protein M7I_0733 [Glarea lozoyensis 74030]|uniref:Uncharacterized protein n=1 Tax=Glarea lozoyensis (strain ATCC 74030 / MF5533) TaxID=1104152 RepID=H0EE61_GLAL7|nr:hypothetical protein M7I_0733 [Glarea lozoyensis 74030]